MREFTEFDYLLNAMEFAAQQDNPADHDYYSKRKAVLDYVAKLQVAQPEEGSRWQPMETAPKDGSKFLIVCATDENPEIEVCDWFEMEDWHWERLSEDTYRKVVTGKRGSWNSNGHRATHWMPLPALPEPQVDRS